MHMIPNILTLARLLMVPLIIMLMMEQQMMWAFILFVIAGITDGLDGFLAKRYGWTTEFGAWLDPVADKALLVSIYVTLGSFGILPKWLVILVVSRDLLIVGGVVLSWLMNRPLEMRPLMVSKINTVAQILLAAIVLADQGFNLGLGNLIFVLVLAVSLTTMASAFAYLRNWFQHMVYFE